MVDSSQNLTNISPVRSINTDNKNIFVKQAIGNFWDFIDTALVNNNFSWTDNIQGQIQQIESEAAKFQSFLAEPSGNKLDLTC